jgi:hypothetical protein
MVFALTSGKRSSTAEAEKPSLWDLFRDFEAWLVANPSWLEDKGFGGIQAQVVTTTHQYDTNWNLTASAQTDSAGNSSLTQYQVSVDAAGNVLGYTHITTNTDASGNTQSWTHQYDTNWNLTASAQTDSAGNSSLTELGIDALSLASTQSMIVDNGNLIGLMGSYTTADGKTHTMGDVWFQIDPSGQRVFDLAAALTTHHASAAAGKVEVSQSQVNEQLTVTLEDVLHLGRTDIVGQVELMIEGSGSRTLDLSGSDHWSDSGQALICGEYYAAYVDPVHQARLFVNDTLNVVL